MRSSTGRLLCTQQRALGAVLVEEGSRRGHCLSRESQQRRSRYYPIEYGMSWGLIGCLSLDQVAEKVEP